jgi:carboxypeptidase Q
MTFSVIGPEVRNPRSSSIGTSWSGKQPELKRLKTMLLRMVSRTLTMASAGWSPSTSGLVHGKVVHVAATKRDELRAYMGKLRGAIVIFDKPSELMSQEPANGPYSGLDVQAPKPPERRTPSEAGKFDKERRSFLKGEGVAAVLYDSGKHNGLLSISNVADDYEFREALPTAMLTHEDYSLVWRLLQKGDVEIQIALTNSFSDAPVEVHNVVAEIRGAEKPDEAVILCAHLDSWDLGPGSTDDGTGVVSVLEAMRAIKAIAYVRGVLSGSFCSPGKNRAKSDRASTSGSTGTSGQTYLQFWLTILARPEF